MPPAPVWWATWFSLQVGNGLSHTVLRKSEHAASAVSIPQELWFLALIPVFAGIFIRCKLLPRHSGTPHGLALSIVGAGLCELSLIVGNFLFHPHLATFGILTAMGVGLFVPVHLPRSRVVRRP
jgi:hypothetical protein